MTPKMVMFLGLTLAAGTLISLTFAGAWMGDTDLDIANSFNVFKQATLFGTWSVTIPNLDFFLVGFKSLVMFDFAFFSGPMALLQWFLFMTLGLGVMWGLYTVVIYALQAIFARR